jgi:hypothetical protein
MNKDDVIREVMSMRGVGYQIAKAILKLSEAPPETFRSIGPTGSFARMFGHRRPMSQSEALRYVLAAKERIALVDEGD